ncbi:MAG: tetratricopeptide repeat protein [Pirellulales bacterium]
MASRTLIAAAGLAVLINGADFSARAGGSHSEARALLQELPGRPPISPLESGLLNDAADGRWDEHSLFTAAQIASGVTTEAELLAAVLDFAALAGDLRAKLTPAQTAEQRAIATLAFLHRRLLSGGYDLAATELPHVFTSGRFNCVSATVLFNSLAAEVGLTVRALGMPQHTCSLLLDGDLRIRVEATCPDWFEARHRAGVVPSSITTHLGSSEDPPEVGVPISDVALVAMIYYNRGVDALRHNDFEQAITLNRLALALDPENSEAKGNLLSAINKRALELAAQRHFATAIELVEHGLMIDPNHSTLRQNRVFIDRARQHATDHASR